jgi:hypothetical protein
VYYFVGVQTNMMQGKKRSFLIPDPSNPNLALEVEEEEAPVVEQNARPVHRARLASIGAKAHAATSAPNVRPSVSVPAPPAPPIPPALVPPANAALPPPAPQLPPPPLDAAYLEALTEYLEQNLERCFAPLKLFVGGIKARLGIEDERRFYHYNKEKLVRTKSVFGGDKDEFLEMNRQLYGSQLIDAFVTEFNRMWKEHHAQAPANTVVSLVPKADTPTALDWDNETIGAQTWGRVMDREEVVGLDGLVTVQGIPGPIDDPPLYMTEQVVRQMRDFATDMRFIWGRYLFSDLRILRTMLVDQLVQSFGDARDAINRECLKDFSLSELMYSPGVSDMFAKRVVNTMTEALGVNLYGLRSARGSHNSALYMAMSSGMATRNARAQSQHANISWFMCVTRAENPDKQTLLKQFQKIEKAITDTINTLQRERAELHRLLNIAQLPPNTRFDRALIDHIRQDATVFDNIRQKFPGSRMRHTNLERAREYYIDSLVSCHQADYRLQTEVRAEMSQLRMVYEHLRDNVIPPALVYVPPQKSGENFGWGSV